MFLAKTRRKTVYIQYMIRQNPGFDVVFRQFHLKLFLLCEKKFDEHGYNGDKLETDVAQFVCVHKCKHITCT